MVRTYSYPNPHGSKSMSETRCRKWAFINGSMSSSALPKLYGLAPTYEAFSENAKSSLPNYFVAFTGSSLSSGTWSKIIWMAEGHYLEIVMTVHPSNWNSTRSRFHYATHLVWLQEWHFNAVHVQGLVVTREDSFGCKSIPPTFRK
jgi:hypothetical protein